MTTLAVTSAGRRRYVVEALLAAAGPDDTLVAVDMNPDAPALSVPGVVSVVADGPGAVRTIDLLRPLGVDAVISLHDYEAIDFAGHSTDFNAAAIRFIGPDRHSAITVIDKLALAAHLASTAPGLEVPTYAVADIPPGVSTWVLKDRYGSGSSGLETVSDPADVARIAQRRAQFQGWHPDGAERPIQLVAQPFLSGREFNVDLFYGAPGELRGHCLKEKGAMRGGETDTAHVRLDTMGIVERLHSALGELHFLGNVDVDVMVDGEDFRVLDVNPRFGGGYAFSALANYGVATSVWTLARREPVRTYHTPDREVRAAKYIAVTELAGFPSPTLST